MRKIKLSFSTRLGIIFCIIFIIFGIFNPILINITFYIFLFLASYIMQDIFLAGKLSIYQQALLLRVLFFADAILFFFIGKLAGKIYEKFLRKK